jgi:hypothetical protein
MKYLSNAASLGADESWVDASVESDFLNEKTLQIANHLLNVRLALVRILVVA